jgi:phosphoglycerol transferase
MQTGRHLSSRVTERLAIASARVPTWMDALFVASASVIIALCAFTAGRVDLHTPFTIEGDAYWYQFLIKSVIRHGWYSTNPEIGAPFGAHLLDFPVPEPTHFLIIRLLGWLSDDPFVLFNLFFLTSFATCAIAARWAFERLGTGRLLAIAGAILFAILPYHFLRLIHLFLASYFAVPIFSCHALRLAMYRAPHVDGAPSANWGSLLGIAVAAGSGIYYAFFGCLFIAVGSFVGATRSRYTAPIRTGIAYIATIVAVIALSLAPSVAYHLAEGGNPAVAHRSPFEAEIYGLKITQLFLPTIGHRIAWFNAITTAYNRNAPLVTENYTAALGLVGSLGLIAAMLVFFSGSTRRQPELFAAGALSTAGVLYSTIGGFGAIAAMVAIPELRGLDRISVFIAFFSLFSVLVLARRTGLSSRPIASSMLAVLLIACAWIDQIPSRWVALQRPAEFHRQQEFFRRVQAELAPGSAVFELPYMYFPESPNQAGSYALLVPYLHTTGLRWSFGEMRGRPADVWNEQASKLDGADLAAALAHAGFSAIYVERRGYQDHGVAVERSLAATFGAPVLEDDTLGKALYRMDPIAPSARPLVVVDIGHHWFPWETAASGPHVWSKGNADLMVANPAKRAVRVHVRLAMRTLLPRHIRIDYGDQPLSELDLAPGMTSDTALAFMAKPGLSSISMVTDTPAQRPGTGDPRRLAFHIEKLILSSEP